MFKNIGGGYYRGAIYNEGIIDNISNFVYEGNSEKFLAIVSDGVYESGSVRVGAISDSQFVNNNTDYILTSDRGIYGTISNSIFANNTLTGSVIYGNANVVTNSLFKNNTGSNGAAIRGGTIGRLSNTQFIGNTSSNEGGAINGTFTKVQNVDFLNNTAATKGGAWMYARYSGLFGNVNFIGNKAGTQGGALFSHDSDLYNAANSTVKFQNNRVISDTEDTYGGAIYRNGSSYWNNVEFTGNYAMSTGEDKGGYGGAIAGGGFIQLIDPVIQNNAASTMGGGIYSTGNMYIIAKDKDIEFLNNRVGDIILNDDGTISDVQNAVPKQRRGAGG